MNQCLDYNCPHRSHWSGRCTITACIREHPKSVIVDERDVIIFPHTIGNITFYNKKELIDWVLMQQD